MKKMLSSDEFDRRFDSGEDIEEFVDWSQKPVIIEPQPEPQFADSHNFASIAE
jgi:hypothetical protein